MHCPFCGHTVIEGADDCDKCKQPLNHLSAPKASGLAKSIWKDRIASLNPRPALTVDTNAPVSAVLSMLVEHSIGCVVVTKLGQIQGIFSERDALLKLNTDAERLGDRPVSDFMTQKVETLESDVKIAFALHKMSLGGYRHIPITKGGRLEGVISVRDILRYMTDNLLIT